MYCIILQEKNKEDTIMKRLICLLLVVMLCVLCTGCTGFFKDNSKGAEKYLEEKYGEDFFEVRKGIYSPGDNSAEYFFCSKRAGGSFTFNVWEREGEFYDNYYDRQKAHDFQYKIEDTLRRENIDALVYSIVHDVEDYDGETFISYGRNFSYIAIKNSADVHKVKDVLIENHKSGECDAVSIYVLPEDDWKDLAERYHNVTYELNSTYCEDYDDYIKYSFNAKNGKWEFWKDTKKIDEGSFV